jgi:hypothetical protein
MSHNEKVWGSFEKTFGEPNRAHPYGLDIDPSGDSGLVLSVEQTKLLKTVVKYLNQASTVLSSTNNRFLSDAAKNLAHKINTQFKLK